MNSTAHTYTVKLTRISYSTHTIKVEANNEEDAKRQALNKAGDYSYSEYDAEYEVDYIEPITHNTNTK